MRRSRGWRSETCIGSRSSNIQQAKRNYYQFRDRVQRDVRSSLRQLKLDDLNFELRRAAVHVAITQVDLARLRLSEPARPVSASLPGQPTQPGGQSQFGETVARDLVTAIIDLLNVQNDFLSVWVDHEVQQLNLDFDLGVMELDARGVRIEHNQPLKTFLTNLPCTAPCEDPDACEFLNAEMAEHEPAVSVARRCRGRRGRCSRRQRRCRSRISSFCRRRRRIPARNRPGNKRGCGRLLTFFGPAGYNLILGGSRDFEAVRSLRRCVRPLMLRRIQTPARPLRGRYLARFSLFK